MTAMTVDNSAGRGWPWGRIVVVSRVLYANWFATLGFPLGIMGSSFLINLLIFAGIGDAVETPVTGGLASLYVVMLAVSWQGLFQNFSFAVGLNATRRAYFAAALLVAFGQSVCYGLLLYGLGAIERATDAWGVHLRFFDPLPLTHSSSPMTLLVYVTPLMLMSVVGLFCGAVTKRWGTTGMFVLTVLVILVFGGAAALISFLDGWPSVGSWLVHQSWRSVVAGWSWVSVAVVAAGGWLVLRRAVP